VAITTIEALREYLFSPSGEVFMALLHFLKKLHQVLVSSLLSILEILHTCFAAL
jgi:hypothetical protein